MCLSAECQCRDGWDALLLHSLLLLRDVCQRLKLHQEALLHSLEVACLADSLAISNDSQAAPTYELANHQQAEACAEAALAGLLTGAADKKSSIMKAGTNNSQAVAGPDGVLHQQQQAVGVSAIPARSSSSPVSSVWCYTVQQLDLSTVAQQLPDGPRAANVADILQQ